MMKAQSRVAFVLVLCLLGWSCSGRPAESHQHEMPHDFADAERWSKVFDSPQRQASQKPTHVIEVMKIEPGMTVVDLGAGTGYFLPYLSKAVGESGAVLALEIEQTLVDHLTARASNEGLGNVRAQVVAPDDPGLDPGTVDRFLIVNTWHHLPDREQYAAKLRAALAEAGRVFIVDFTVESETGPHKKHRIPPEKVADTLRRAGLDATIETEELPEQYIVSAGAPR